MTGALSKLSPPSDTRQGYLRPQTSRAHRFDDASDVDIRNLVEGYRTEADVLADAAASFCGLEPAMEWLGSDEDWLTCKDDWISYRDMWVSAAREAGELPALDAA